MQKKLDLISNIVMIGETEWAGHLAAMAREEMEGIYPIPEMPAAWNPGASTFPYLPSMLHDSFMSRPNIIVVPGGKWN